MADQCPELLLLDLKRRRRKPSTRIDLYFRWPWINCRSYSIFEKTNKKTNNFSTTRCHHCPLTKHSESTWGTKFPLCPLYTNLRVFGTTSSCTRTFKNEERGKKNPVESSSLHPKKNRTRVQSLFKKEREKEMKKQIPDWSVFRGDGFLWSIVKRGRSDVASLCDVPVRIASCDLSTQSDAGTKGGLGWCIRRAAQKTSEKDHLSDGQQPSSHIWKAESATPPLGASLRTRRSSKFHFCLPRCLFPRTLLYSLTI